MSTYRLLSNGVLKDEGLETEACIPADTNNIDWQEFLVWQAEGNTPDPMIAVVTPPARRWITRLAFFNRFTITEQVTLELGSVDNPNASMAQRQLEATLRVFIRNVNSSTYIDLDRADVVQGVNTLATYGLITAARATEILTATLKPEEVYHP